MAKPGIRDSRILRDRAFLPVLFLALIASAALLIHYRSGLGFMADDWAFIFKRLGGGVDSFAEPHAEHVVILFVAIYKLFASAFGISSAMPLHLFSVAMFLVAVVMLFVYVRRLVGVPAAVIGAVVVLFLGAGYEDLLWPFQTAFSISIATGIAALLMIERKDKAGDLLACLLLSVSVLTVTLGLPFLAGAIVSLIVSRHRIISRSYVVVVPLILFGIWYIGWGTTGESFVSIENALATPKYVFDSFSYSIAVLTGTFRLDGTLGTVLPHVLAVLLVALLGFRIHRERRVPPQLLVALAVGLTFWGLAGLNQIPGAEARSFDQSRYQVPNAVITLMILSGAFAGWMPRPRQLAAIAVVAVAAVAVNLGALADGYQDRMKPLSERALASLTALDLMGEVNVTPAFAVPLDSFGLNRVEAATYFAVSDEYGKAGWSEAELRNASPDSRQSVDRVLLEANPVEVSRVDNVGKRSCPDPDVIPGTAGESVSLTPGGILLEASQDTKLGIGRFSDGTPVDAGVLPGGQPTWVRPPATGGGAGWRLGFSGPSPVTVCEP